jgi:tetratricopeptide (TPR) repeat protein
MLFNSRVLLSQSAPASLFKKIDSIKRVLKIPMENRKKVYTLYWLSTYYAGFENYRESPAEYYVDSAIKFAKLASELSNFVPNNPYQKCICLGWLGAVHTRFYPAQGLKYYFASIKECKASGRLLAVSNTYHNLTNIFSQWGDHSEALKYNLAALEIRKKINRKYFIAASYHNIRRNYYDMGNYEQALNYAFLAFKNDEVGFKKDEENLTKEQLAVDRIQIGACYAQLGKFDEALKYLHDALATFQELKLQGYNQRLASIDWLANINVYLGISYAKRASQITHPESKKMYIKAVDYLNKGLSIEPLQQLRRDAYPVLSEIYKEMGDFEKALEYKNRLTALNDSILNYEIQNRIKHVKIEYETEQTIAEQKANHDKLVFGVLAISIISCVLILLILQKINKRRAIERAEELHKMGELELQSLRAQLNPHFMFNSLNAIQELILKEDNDNSHLYLSRFSELLRMLLDNADRPFVSIRKEVSLLDLYLSLEKLRIPDLRYSIEINNEIDASKITIPNMMLQPYIENAIWHGLSSKKGEKNLNINIRRKGDCIVYEVEDNGVGRKVATELKSLYRKEHHSKGMELLSKRFSLLSKEYGYDIQTGVEDLHDNGSATGTRVTITVPVSLTEKFQPAYS